MKPTQPDWKKELKNIWKSLMEMGWIVNHKNKPTKEDIKLELKTYFWLEDFIESLLLSQQAQYRAELIEKVNILKNANTENYMYGLEATLAVNEVMDEILGLLKQ